MGAFKNFVFAVLSANLLALLLLAWAAERNGHIQLGGVEVKSLDLASLALVAATLVVTGVGVLAALLAVWGYKEIKASSGRYAGKIAKKIAVEVATKVATEVAQAVASRTTMEATASQTTTAQADLIVKELSREEGHDGS